MKMSSLDDNFASDELNRRLQSIDETLCQQRSKREPSRRKLYTSEISKIEDSHNFHDSREQAHAHAEKLDNRGIWLDSQDAKQRKGPGVLLAPGDSMCGMPLFDTPSEVCLLLEISSGPCHAPQTIVCFGDLD